MKKTSTYLPSIILSVLLVFSLMISAAVLLMDLNFTAGKLKNMASENNIDSKIYVEIEKYYKDKFNSSGIPGNVYMDAINDSYLKNCEEIYIEAAFEALNGNGKMNVTVPKNKELENSITDFFFDFAEKNNYQKDEKFEAKLNSAKENAYFTIGSFCDVYKFSTMSGHGVLPKLAKLYSNRMILTVCSIAVTVIIFFMLLVVNRKNKATALYWYGTSCTVAGLLGSIPGIYLVATKFFDSFSIKQAPVFTAFTSFMYKYSGYFIAVHISFIVLGAIFFVVYGLVKER